MTLVEIQDDALNVVNMLDTILERVVAGFEEYGVELPERRYWTTGQPAADCEQLTVTLNQIYVGPPGDEADEPQRCHSPRTAQLDIQVLRCVPSPVGPRGRAPAAEAIQGSSRSQAIDAWILLDLACTLDTWEQDNFGHQAAPGLGVIATVDMGQVEGAYQGPVMHLTVAIP